MLVIHAFHLDVLQTVFSEFKRVDVFVLDVVVNGVLVLLALDMLTIVVVAETSIAVLVLVNQEMVWVDVIDLCNGPHLGLTLDILV